MAEPKAIVLSVERPQTSDLVRLDIEVARRRLKDSLQALKGDLNVVKVVKRSVQAHPVWWLLGAFATGALLGSFSVKGDRHGR